MKSQEKLSQRDFIIQINRESRDHLINSKQELYIKVSGKEDSEMDLENKLGLMVLSTLENGEKTELTEREDSFMWMEIYMMVFGQMIKLMVLEYTNMSMELNMKESGKMIFNMEKE